MDDVRCVRCETTAEIFEATKAYDDGFTNLSLGSFHDYLRSAAAVEPSEPAYFFAVYRGDDLLLTLAHHALSRAAWQLVCPQSADHLLTPALLDAATQQLAVSLLAATHPNILSSVNGHDGAVKAFMKAWQTLVEKEGTHLRIAPKPIMVTRSSYAIRESLTPSPNTPHSFNLTPATEGDFEEIFPWHLDFMSWGPTRPLAVEEADLRRTIASGTMWICRDGRSRAGYIVTSRSTPRTIAIRNVYVPPAHRRKGVASFMVRAMSRYHLGVQPVGYEGIPDGLPETGVKDFVCLNVAEPGAERIYRRAGFLFPEPTEDGSSRGGLDLVSGQKAWYPSVWLGFEPQSAP